jgi:hypothetical protein
MPEQHVANAATDEESVESASQTLHHTHRGSVDEFDGMPRPDSIRIGSEKPDLAVDARPSEDVIAALDSRAEVEMVSDR